jgi:hypothetical protein
LTALNGLTAQVQNFATGTSGTDFAISSATNIHTFNLPTASATNRGALSSADWTTFNNKASTAALAAYLPLAGGTLTGTLNGTSANFTNNVTIDRSLSSLGNALTLTKGSDADQAWLAFQQGAAADGVWRLGYTGDPYDFRINVGSNASIGSQALRIFETTQNVKIGTGSNDDGFKLDVVGSGRFSGALTGTSANFSGNVGIGTNTPEGTGLTIAGGGILVSLSTAAARQILELYTQSGIAKVSASYVGASSYGDLQLLTSNLPRLTILAGGNVQIDDSGSSSKLAVRGGNSTYPASSSASYTLSLNDPTSAAVNVGGSIIFQGFKTSNTSTGNFAGIVGKKQNGTSGDESGFLGFLTSDSGGTFSEQMRITSSGNMVIGTTTDFGVKLAVNGNIYMSTGTDREIFMGSGSAYNYRIRTIGDDFFINEAGNPAKNRLKYVYADERWYILGGLTISGSLSKGSGSFKIDHPLPEKKDTHHLVHSFVEAPQADNIYRGKIELVDGLAEVNIDEVSGMSEGTFVLLNGNIQCFTSNESGWTAIRGKVEGNILKIEAQDSKCADIISWLVIGERIDQHMKDTDWTDENGKVIVEPLKKQEKESEILNEDLQNQNQTEDESNA